MADSSVNRSSVKRQNFSIKYHHLVTNFIKRRQQREREHKKYYTIFYQCNKTHQRQGERECEKF